jgi:2,4-dienoyl-CoA reductase-like NADH-dependent reductase (Old Yellow Enzyme family)
MTDLFAAYDLAGLQLANRIVMAPMTRSRAPADIADERIALYYAQRGTAGLMVTEGTPISREGQGYLFNPGIFTPAQIAGWRLTTQSVHAVGGHIFAQLWHVGRVSHTSLQEGGAAPVSATSLVANGAMAFAYDEDGKPGFVQSSTPRPLATAEVGRVVEDFAQAAVNAMEAGFDGVEIHSANGYLFEQFINKLVNNRTDRYGNGSIENRLRFTLDVVDAIIARIGGQKVGIRISPYGQLFDMPHYDDMDEIYTALADALGTRGIAYVHVMDQSGYVMGESTGESFEDRLYRLLRRFRQGLGKTSMILAGGMTLAKAQKLIDRNLIDLAAFGQPFIANPDLVARLRHGWALSEPDRRTYYGGGAAGYVDYPPHRAD